MNLLFFALFFLLTPLNRGLILQGSFFRPNIQALSTMSDDTWRDPALDPLVNPLTGERVEDVAVLNHRPIAVKISNSPPFVRPQSGLNQADIVLEHYVEGGVTRFTAIYYSQSAEIVGSIRSSRLIDLDISQMYDAALAIANGNDEIEGAIANSDLFTRTISPAYGHNGFYRLGNGLPYEHTLFTDIPLLRDILAWRGEDRAPQLSDQQIFSTTPPNNGIPARRIFLPYPATNVYWFYSAEQTGYLRWTDGEPHLSSPENTQLAFDNVIILFAPHNDSEITQDLWGNLSTEIDLSSKGRGILLREGLRYEGQWVRTETNAPVRLLTLSGEPIPLAVGRTFIQIVPTDYNAYLISR